MLKKRELSSKHSELVNVRKLENHHEEKYEPSVANCWFTGGLLLPRCFFECFSSWKMEGIGLIPMKHGKSTSKKFCLLKHREYSNFHDGLIGKIKPSLDIPKSNEY